MRLFKLAAAAIVATASIVGAASAADYPSKKITFVNPFKPGGGTDHFMRALEPTSEAHFGESIEIEYRRGGAGLVAWKHMLDQPADGYTVLGEITSGVSAILKETTPPVQVEDMRVLARYGIARLILTGSKELPFDDWDGFVAHAKANPGELSVGGAEIVLLAGSAVFSEIEADVNFIPYPGTGPTLTDLFGGHIDMAIVAAGSIPKLEGKANVIANISDVDLSEAQKKSVGDVFWVGSRGIEGFGLPRFYAVHPDTPDAVYQELSKRIANALADPAVNERLLAIGEQVDPATGDEAQAALDRFLKTARASVSKLTN